MSRNLTLKVDLHNIAKSIIFNNVKIRLLQHRNGKLCFANALGTMQNSLIATQAYTYS